MTVFWHEIKRGKISFMVWSAAVAFMLALCVLIYPEMGAQMEDMGAMFADMGSFSAAFGMDQINFGEFIGFFGVECGNVLGLGGVFFAAIIGISALSKEEKEHTAEFLLAHPVPRAKIIGGKLCAAAAQVTMLNIVTLIVTVVSVLIIGEELPVKVFLLLFFAYYLMQLETAAITFGISAFLKSGSLGIGLGLAAVFYFLNILANLTEKMKFLKYITPFGYTDGADIIANESLSGGHIAVGIVLAAIGVGAAFYRYQTKDIA